MSARGVAIFNLALLVGLWLLSGVKASAQTVVRFVPDHDWTISIGGQSYGLHGYGSNTSIIWGRRHAWVRMNIFVLAAPPALLIVVIAVFIVRGFVTAGTSRTERSPPSDAPT